MQFEEGLSGSDESFGSKKNSNFWCYHAGQSVLHTIQVALLGFSCKHSKTRIFFVYLFRLHIVDINLVSKMQ